MMTTSKKSLLTALLLGASFSTPLLAQDLRSALNDLEADRYTKAGQTLTQLANSAPTAQNQFYLGYYYLRTGQLDQAKAAFDKAAAADKKDQLHNIGLAGIALMKGDRATAKQLIDQAVNETKGKNTDVLLRAAEMYTLSDKTNDPAEAIRLLEMAKARDKKGENTSEIDMILGDAYFLKNDGGNAITKYENALQANPKLAEANYKIGRLYLRGKNYTKAQEYFTKAIETDETYAPTYLGYADALANSRAYKKAAENYEKYVQSSGTTDPERLLDVARYRFLAEDFQGATSYLDQLKGKVNNPIMDRMYGWAYYGLNKPQESVDALNKFIQESPNKVMSDDYKYLGRAYGMLNTPEGDSLSIINLEKAAKDDTVDNLYRDIATKYYETKRYDKAVDYWDKAIAREEKPKNNDFLYKGLSNYMSGFQALRDTTVDSTQRAQKGNAFFTRADSAFGTMAKQVEAGGATYPLAYYYQGMSNYYAYPQATSLERATAVPYFEKFIEQANAEPDAEKKKAFNKNLISSYKMLYYYADKKGESDKAKEYMQKVLELDPNDETAKRALEPAPAAAPAKAATKTTTKVIKKK